MDPLVSCRCIAGSFWVDRIKDGPSHPWRKFKLSGALDGV